MKREIICRECAVDRVQLQEHDLDNGFQERSRYVAVDGELCCDSCSALLFTGEIALAVTTWIGTEPKDWESGYGTLLPDHVALTAIILSES